jgi:hypothetical protein
MTFEARLIIVLLLFAMWGFLGLLPWSLLAALRRGRNALPALPIAIGAACLAGVLVPLVGARDETGFLVSIVAAFAGGVIGTVSGIEVAKRVFAPPAEGGQREEEG